MGGTGESFVEALSGKDAERLRGLFTTDVDFKGLTPGRSWEGTGPDDVLDVLLANWFEPHDEIVEVRAVSTEEVADRSRVTYRFGLSCSGKPHVTEQHAFFETDESGRIRWLRMMCSGFRPE
jgi:hypothetical protein